MAGRRAEGPGQAWKRSLQAALLAASILHSHVLLTQATIWPETEIQVTWEPSWPQTRDNLTLIPGGGPRKLLSCSWYRGWTTAKEKKIISFSFLFVQHRKGKSHTGRETTGPNCSLHIRNLTALDSGNYTVKKKRFGTLEIGHAYVEISDPTLSKLSPGTVSGIVIGSLLAVTAGIGALLYFFLCGRNHRSWWNIKPNGPILAPAQPVSNEYILPSAQEEPQAQVEPSNVFDSSQAYQKLQVQHGSQDVYHDLKKPYLLPPGSSSWTSVPFGQSHVVR